MRRREFILAGGATVVLPLIAGAQQPGRVYRLGSLSQSPRTSPIHIAFFGGLRKEGFIEGQNLIADEDGYALRPDQIREHAQQLAKAQVDVIVCGGDPVMQIALEATKSIPIVGNGTDLVGSGVVQSLAKPGATRLG